MLDTSPLNKNVPSGALLSNDPLDLQKFLLDVADVVDCFGFVDAHPSKGYGVHSAGTLSPTPISMQRERKRDRIRKEADIQRVPAFPSRKLKFEFA